MKYPVIKTDNYLMIVDEYDTLMAHLPLNNFAIIELVPLLPPLKQVPDLLNRDGSKMRAVQCDFGDLMEDEPQQTYPKFFMYEGQTETASGHTQWIGKWIY